MDTRTQRVQTKPISPIIVITLDKLPPGIKAGRKKLLYCKYKKIKNIFEMVKSF